MGMLSPPGSGRDVPRELAVQRLVLQPVVPKPQVLHELRMWFREHRWSVVDEKLMEFKNRFYLTLVAEANLVSNQDHHFHESGEEDVETRSRECLFPQPIRRRVLDAFKASEPTLEAEKELKLYLKYIR